MITQYKDEDRTVQHRMKMQEDTMQHKDLDKVGNNVEGLFGLRRELELKVGKWGTSLLLKLTMYRVFMLRNLRPKR